jgi:hypothetical protein
MERIKHIRLNLIGLHISSLEPILRLRNLQLQRQRCCMLYVGRLERFSKQKKKFSKRTRLLMAL